MTRAWSVALAGTVLVLAGVSVRAAVAPPWPWLALNLGLAWIPALLGAVAARRPALLLALGPAWLLFLPNAPYLLTDLVHLRARPPVPMWFDVALLGGAGALGLWIGALSLAEVSGAARAWFGRGAAFALRVGAPLLSGFGMYLGRFLRWNSWDLVLRPGDVLADVASPWLDPVAHGEAWGFTATFGALFLVAGLAVRTRRDGEVRAG